MSSALAAVPPFGGRLAGLPVEDALEGLSRLHQLVFVADQAGEIVWTSDALGAIAARPLVGERISELVREAGRGPVLDALVARAFAGDVLVAERVEVHRSGGAVLSLEVSAFTAHGSDGQRFFVAIARPHERTPTSPTETPSGLAASILEASPEAVVATDANGFVTFANARSEALLGKPREEMLRKPLALILHDADGLENALATLGSPGEREIHIERDGARAWYAVRAEALHDERGTTIGNAYFCRDISEQRALEARFADTTRELEHYVRSVSHDLRSPLVAVLGFERLLRQDYADVLDEQGLHFLGRIEHGGRRMQRLIEDLHALAQLGEGDERATAVDPRLSALAAQAELRARLDATCVDLEIQASGPAVLCPRVQFQQLLVRVIDDALERVARQPMASVELTWQPCSRAAGRIEFRVSHASPPDDAPGATGEASIGLAIARKIVALQGGRLWVECNPASRTHTVFTLPAATRA